MSLLDVRQARVDISGLVVLSDLDLQVHDGDFLGLVGLNGTGKTTLLDAIGGQVSLDSGTIRLDDYDITHAAVWMRSRYGIGRVFQDGRLWPGLTPADHFKLAAWSPSGGSVEAEEIREVIDLVELRQAAMSSRISQLVLLDRRRVELALHILRKPTLLLLDEIAAGLNLAESLSAYGYVGKAMKRRSVRAVIAVEHKIGLLSAFATELVLLEAGVIQEREAVASRADATLVRSYPFGQRKSHSVAEGRFR